MEASINAPEAWPPLPYREWEPTKRTLHRFVQIVGKVRMALMPYRNHWWHVTLYVDTRALTTGPKPYGDRDAEIASDFLDHRLRVTTSDGRERGFALADPLPCADFHKSHLRSTTSGSPSPSTRSRSISAGGRRFQTTRAREL